MYTYDVSYTCPSGFEVVAAWPVRVCVERCIVYCNNAIVSCARALGGGWANSHGGPSETTHITTHHKHTLQQHADAHHTHRLSACMSHQPRTRGFGGYHSLKRPRQQSSSPADTRCTTSVLLSSSLLLASNAAGPLLPLKPVTHGKPGKTQVQLHQCHRHSKCIQQVDFCSPAVLS